MKLITTNLDKRINREIIVPAREKNYQDAGLNSSSIQKEIYNNIPDKKRISYGIVHTIRILAKCITRKLEEKEENLLNIGTGIYSQTKDDISRGIALGILSEYGKEDFPNTSPFFISAALDQSWQMREFAQMFFRKLIKAHPDEAKEFLMESVKNANPLLRRFVSETLRPVQENKWIHNQPNYSLSVLKKLYKEKDEYPRKSVANNLSDLSKKNPSLILKEISDLASMNDRNSYSIAYRASRNLVKENPLEIMNILKINEYKYKNKKYSRSDYQ